MAVETAPLPEPVRKTFVEESAKAAACLVVVGSDWQTDRGFGHPTSDLTQVAECPVLVIRSHRWRS